MKLNTIISRALDIAVKAIKKELRDQGHNNSKQLSDSIEGKIITVTNGLRGELYMLDRYKFINLYSSNIPFSGSRGVAKKSKYIQALIKFFKSKGAKNPISAAFATAWKQKKEGRPTKGSYLFSKNKRRTGFLDVGLASVEEQIFELISTEVNNAIVKSYG
jgi:hypothetical protein